MWDCCEKLRAILKGCKIVVGYFRSLGRVKGFVEFLPTKNHLFSSYRMCDWSVTYVMV